MPSPVACGRAKSPAQPGQPWEHLGPGIGFFLFVLLSRRYLFYMTKVMEGKSYKAIKDFFLFAVLADGSASQYVLLKQMEDEAVESVP